jgi:hypothetical protein
MAPPSRVPIDEARCVATRAVAAHPKAFTSVLSAHFGVTRAGIAHAVRQLELEGFIQREKAGTRPVFAPGPSRLVDERVALPGVDESLLWEQKVAPWLRLEGNVANIAHFAFTEMVNNANDHAEARELHVRAMQTADALYLRIADDGIGAFRRIARSLRLEDERLAVLELSKGKFSSDPSRHSGEGVFFSSRAVDAFLMRANGLEYWRHEAGPSRTGLAHLSALAGEPASGTVVVMALALQSERRLRDVFDAYTTGAPDDLTFDRTVVPVRLARVGSENLLSRSQAKRLIARFEHFRRVELDFDEVPEIGQAFADELFRVFGGQHPEVQLVPLNMAPSVAAMVRRAGFGQEGA